jgi:hypothetical protein
LRDLLRLRKAGRIDLVTSPLVEEEISRYAGEFRELQQDIYALLTDVPSAPEARTDSGLTLRGVGGSIEDPTFTALKSILPDTEDARHVFQALSNGVDYFVTDDQRTLLSRAAEVEARFSILLRLPSQVVQDLQSDAASES